MWCEILKFQPSICFVIWRSFNMGVGYKFRFWEVITRSSFVVYKYCYSVEGYKFNHSVKLLRFLKLRHRATVQQQLDFKKHNLLQHSDALILTGCNVIQVFLKSGIWPTFYADENFIWMYFLRIVEKFENEIIISDKVDLEVTMCARCITISCS